MPKFNLQLMQQRSKKRHGIFEKDPLVEVAKEIKSERLTNEVFVNRLSAVIGYYRQGVSVEDIALISGFSFYHVTIIIETYLAQKHIAA